MKMNLLKFLLFCTFVQSVRAVVYTNENGVTFEYMLNFKRRCRSTDGRFAFLHRLSISQCVEQCGLRPHCAALNYRRRAQVCELFSVADEGVKTVGDCLFIPASKINVLQSVCGACEEGKVCDTNTHTCIYKECEAASAPLNGQIFGNKNEIRATIKYQCDNDQPDSSVNAVCQTDGQWSANVNCTTGCGNVSIPHGNIVQDSLDVSKASVTCDAGYQTSISTINCTGSGSWENTTCDPISCGNPTSIANGNIVLNSGTLFQNTATVTCDTGYQESLNVISCTASGSWGTVTCDPISCGVPATIANGIITLNGGTTYQDTASATCDTGFVENTSTIRCTASGSWDTVTCDLISCGSPPSIANGNIALNSGTIYLDTASVTCNANFHASSSTITCTASGSWETASCNPDDCFVSNVWDYAGTKNVTPSGYACENWVDHSSDWRVNAEWMPESTIADAKNYCRQPADQNWNIWCFSSNPNHEYELCGISQC
ncbi:sushi, von Willebrand factor type A, EGF and pentraxin domain-containing protein 1-like [Mercenaria mercenaria]|uniref:sushi, von Willebrand factor type A, EGF and pentraxin domain-containing protein 1-like n=1 Tax=Mercenaria mercenaria TaxID=6596 RepID=UPI00234EC44E|nr:sushi, von Willebrand factor type A, EGF and pentraxin domain-containing protein 1-like [Mercenaria mercenaria]